jgi:Family of unknown function (DUF5832)
MSDFTSSSDATQYRADRETDNKDFATQPPECIRNQLPSSSPSRGSLTDDQLKAARSDLLDSNFAQLQYPKTMKSRVDPTIPRQRWGLVSWIPSQKATPDADGCYGIMKFRGAFDTQHEAEEWGDKLIRDVDSFSEISIVRIGMEFPLFQDDSMYTRSTREIDIRQKTDDIQKANFREKREKENKEMKEIQERRQKLIDGEHQEEKDNSADDIDLYIQLRVKKANAMQATDEAEKTIQTAKDIIRKTDIVLEKIETEHPDYKDEYLERYKRALGAVGSNPRENELIKYMVKDDRDAATPSGNEPFVSIEPPQ